MTIVIKSMTIVIILPLSMTIGIARRYTIVYDNCHRSPNYDYSHSKYANSHSKYDNSHSKYDNSHSSYDNSHSPSMPIVIVCTPLLHQFQPKNNSVWSLNTVLFGLLLHESVPPIRRVVAPIARTRFLPGFQTCFIPSITHVEYGGAPRIRTLRCLVDPIPMLQGTLLSEI